MHGSYINRLGGQENAPKKMSERVSVATLSQRVL